jgi:hypothetical protein
VGLKAHAFTGADLPSAIDLPIATDREPREPCSVFSCQRAVRLSLGERFASSDAGEMR